MPEIELKDKTNKVTGKISLKEESFALKGKESLLHTAVLNYLANQRQGSHATKTRGLVRGGGKKPWRQKHTGRARAGSIRSPLWKGGGIVFGPQPRDYSYSIPKQAKKQALYQAFSKKLLDNEVIVIDKLKLSTPKTKELLNILNDLEIKDKSLLILLHERDSNVLLSARNLSLVSVKLISDVNAYDVLCHERLLITSSALQSLEVKA